MTPVLAMRNASYMKGPQKRDEGLTSGAEYIKGGIDHQVRHESPSEALRFTHVGAIHGTSNKIVLFPMIVFSADLRFEQMSAVTLRLRRNT